MIAIDIETVDPNLQELGDGALRKDGDVICVGIYRPGYERIFDTITPELIDVLASDEPKVFHNGVYDLSWLVFGCGLKVNGRIEDTMTRMGLIDELVPHMDLDSCCKYFGLPGKNKSETIEQWALDHGITGKAIKQLAEIYSVESGRAAIQKYCLQDCKATYDLWHVQEPQIIRYGLAWANEVECRLYPVLMDMKKNGIRIDKVYRDKLENETRHKLVTLGVELEQKYGITPEIIRSPKQMTNKMHELGITSPVKTATGAESWNAQAMMDIDHPAAEAISKMKHLNTEIGLMFDSTFNDKFVIDGHVHPTFYPAKREIGGTVTGRFSCRNPNFQQVSSKSDTGGQELRQIVIPEDGCMLGAFDYSQVEYKIFAHYAVGPKSEWLRAEMRNGKDFHTLGMEISGIVYRPIVKNFGFGAMYGMGIKTLMLKFRRDLARAAIENGMEFEPYCRAVFAKYHRELPFIKTTCKAIEQEALMKGCVTSISGRRHHSPSIDRVFTMTNHKIQGSASDVLKLGLVDAWNAGVFNTLKLHATVHDENVVSIPYNKEGAEAAIAMQECMNNAYCDELTIPITSEGEVGPNWGYWHDDIWKDMKQGVFDKCLA